MLNGTKRLRHWEHEGAKLELGERQTIINANLLTSMLCFLSLSFGKREQKEGFLFRFLWGHKIAKNKSHW